MRRALAAVVLAVSLWIGSLAWAGFLMTRTVLDPGRSEAVADALLDDPDVRSQLVANTAGGVEAALPDGVDVDRATLEATAEAALDSPEVEALVRSAFVDTHRAFLGEGDPPESIDGVVPGAPEVEIPLPTERVPDLGPVRRALDTAVPLLAAVAAIGASAALVVTSNRPAVLRRAGIWAIGLSAFVLVFAFGVPALAQSVAPAQAAVVAALISALAAATQGPALVLAAAGVAGIVSSFLWRPAAAGARAERRPRHPETQRIPRQPRVRPPAPPRARPPAPPARPRTPRPPSPSPTRVHVHPPAAAPTRVDAPPGRRWVDGVGWVVEGSDSIPSEARWVPGVGYVVDP